MQVSLTRYMFRRPIGWYIVGGIFSALTFLLLVFWLIGRDIKPIGFAFFIPLVLLSIFLIMRSKKLVKNFESDPLFRYAEAEFVHSVPMRKDRIRFGNTMVFINGSGKLLRYSDIAQIYQYIHKTNFVENERCLKYVDLSGKHHKLCPLELRDKSIGEVMQIVELIQKKNPNVKIGAY